MKKVWKEDVTALFTACGIEVSKPTVVSFNEATYEYNSDLKANWLYFAFLAFCRLASEILKPQLMVSVGAGSGLDGIAQYEIFHPERLILTDINPEVIKISRSNLADYFARVGAQLQWEVVLGNLCSPVKPQTADVAYANIPTIPGNPADILLRMNSSSFFDPALTEDVPDILARHYLALQYEFLKQARIVLKPGGSVVIALGVRMPASLVEQMFTEAGFGKPEPLVLDIKEQSQDSVVAQAYAVQEERIGTDLFDFYRQDVSKNKFDTGLSLEELKTFLKPWRISAKEALNLCQAGQKVYHVVAILRAKK